MFENIKKKKKIYITYLYLNESMNINWYFSGKLC